MKTLPANLGDALESLLVPLGSLPATDAARFRVRLASCVHDTYGPIAALYGADQADAVVEELVARAVAALVARPAALAVLDAEREVDPGWFQAPDRLGYVAYCELFGPTIADVATRVPYLEQLGVTYFHLMKVIKPRPEPNDGGFAVADYRDVDPALGTLDDLRNLAVQLREAGISLCVDVVMNHTAREHEWAQAARAGDEAKRAYFLVYPDRIEPDDWETSLPEVFPEMAPGNFTWDADLKAWVWTTFNTYQWDLNYANPAVLVEMLDIMLFLANAGVEVLRLDAVAFTWKRKGTDCQNQPEAHLIAQILRRYTNLAAPGALVKAEAIVGPRLLTAYLGQHGEQGQRAECQLAYHNQLMVMIWSSLASHDAKLLSTAMRNLPPIPADAAWATYIRCHDDIGWAVDDGDATAAGVDGWAHRHFLADFYRGDFPGSFATGSSFSVNEETGDERTCGSAASLAGVEKALVAGDSAALDLAVQRVLLAHGLVASFGMPLLYMGDEIALLNDYSYLDDPAKADDSRWMQRPKMDWAVALAASGDDSVGHRVREGLLHVLRAKAGTQALRQGGDVWIIDSGDDRIFSFGRYHPRGGRLLGVANLSEEQVRVRRDIFPDAGLTPWAREVLGAPGAHLDHDALVVPPLGLLWFTDDLAERVVPAPL